MNQGDKHPFFVVLNPDAGKGAAKSAWHELESVLIERRLPYQLIETLSSEEAVANVSRLPDNAKLMVLGGDGTLTALLPAVINTERSLAVMPFGSGNDFAGMLGFESGDYTSALNSIKPSPSLFDVLSVDIIEGEPFNRPKFLLNSMGMGFDAQAAVAMESAPKLLTGFGQYLWGVLSALKNLELNEVEISLDKELLYKGESCLVAVMNGTRYGGGFQISPTSDPKDGKLNAVVGGPVGRLKLISMLSKVIAGKHLSDEKIHHGCGHVCRIKWRKPVHLHLDGDFGGRVSTIEVQTLSNAVRILNG